MILAAVMLFSMQSHSMEKPKTEQLNTNDKVVLAVATAHAVYSAKTITTSAIIATSYCPVSWPFLAAGGVGYVGYKLYNNYQKGK